MTPRLDFQWPGTTILDLYYTAAQQTLRPAEVPTVASLQRVDVGRAGVTFTSAILPRVIGAGSFFVGDAPNIAPAGGVPVADGRIADATASATVRLSNALMLDVSYLFDRLDDAASPQPIYVTAITRIRLGEQFTRALALRAIVQYNRLTVDSLRSALEPSRNLNYDLLFTYLTTPGTAVYVGANYNLADIDLRLVRAESGLLRSPTLNNTGWQVFTKMSYLFGR